MIYSEISTFPDHPQPQPRTPPGSSPSTAAAAAPFSSAVAAGMPSASCTTRHRAPRAMPGMGWDGHGHVELPWILTMSSDVGQVTSLVGCSFWVVFLLENRFNTYPTHQMYIYIYIHIQWLWDGYEIWLGRWDALSIYQIGFTKYIQVSMIDRYPIYHWDFIFNVYHGMAIYLEWVYRYTKC